VHVHFPADTRELRHSATCDLRARQFAESKAEPRLTARH
jgi:hypothetical protein